MEEQHQQGLAFFDLAQELKAWFRLIPKTERALSGVSPSSQFWSD